MKRTAEQIADAIADAIRVRLAALFEAIIAIAVTLLLVCLGAFVLLLLYGLVVIIFRAAFGVELPNPFSQWA